MPRKPRMYLPDMPCHLIQRGNNREATFFSEHDYQFYLECLYDTSIRYGVRIHGVFDQRLGQLEDAKINAVRALRTVQENHTDNPSTQIHELVEYLQQLKK